MQSKTLLQTLSKSIATQIRRTQIRSLSESFTHNPVELEMLDVDLFRSKSLWRPIGARAVYGGQVRSSARLVF